MTRQISAMCVAVVMALLGDCTVAADAEDDSYPTLVTAETRASAEKLSALERPGNIFFQDGFESPDSLKKYFEIRGLREGRVKLTTDAQFAHEGNGAIIFTSPARAGHESGVGATAWFGPDGYNRVYFRRYIKFAADYDQGNLNHVGGGLTGVAGTNRWQAMGSAGIRPSGDSHFKSAFEPWCDWGRYSPPGYMFLYTYWMDMKRDRDGNYWGNMLEPADDERVVLQRDKWYCLEHMIQANDPGEANGELAAWIDGKLYIHYKGFRWRTTPEVKLKRFGIGVYVHSATRDNTVWYDDVALSSGYIGPEKGNRTVQAVIDEVDETCRENTVYMIGPEKAKRLAELVRQKKPKVVVECGTAIGYSGLWIARELKAAGHGKLITIEIDKDRSRQACEYFRRAGLDDIVDARVGDARKLVREIKEPVDFLFIDCNYSNYLPCLSGIEGRLTDGAVVVADNVGIGAYGMKDYLDHVRSKYTSKTEWFDIDLSWGNRDAMEITIVEKKDN